MKEITLRVPDQMVALIENLATHMPEVEVVGMEDMTIETDRDVCMKQAIETLQRNNVFRKQGDYGLILTALKQEVKGDFYEDYFSPLSFLNYLKMLGIGNTACKATLSNAIKNIIGEYPDWTFADKPNPQEELRRKNVVVQFRSAYMRAKRNN